MRRDKEIYCWQIRFEDLEIYMASSLKGALEVHLSLEQGAGALRYFQNRFPLNKVIEDAGRNKPLVKGIQARLTNKSADIPLSFDISCTSFQMVVFETIVQIPFGQTKTYGAVANLIGKKGGARAVGQAMSKNPLPLIFP